MQVTLKNTSAIAVIDTLGAELKSFKDGFATEYIWQADAKYWGKSSPILFPSVGNVRNNKCLFNKKEYIMTKHGFARDMEFKICYQSDEKVIFSLMSNEKTKQMYPYEFNLQVSYELDGCTLHMRYDVFNMGTDDMPYCIGGHPGFNIPVTKEDKFENYNIIFEKKENIVSPIYDLENLNWSSKNTVKLIENDNKIKLSYELFKNDAILFENTKSKKVEIVSILTGRGIRVNYEGFNMIAFWTPYGLNAPFLCVEPWCGTAIFDDEDDNFEKKRGTQILKPNEKNTHIVSMTML